MKPTLLRGDSVASTLAGLVMIGCATTVSLDNASNYPRIDSSRRLTVPCYFALDPSLEKLTVEDGGYRVEMGPAVSAQLRAALLGLCRGARAVASKSDFRRHAPAVLFEVSVSADMNARMVTWAVNTGKVAGTAVVTGTAHSESLTIDFRGDGKKRQYYAEVGSGAEGLRRALAAAIEDLVGKAAERREEIQRLARGEERPVESPNGPGSDASSERKPSAEERLRELQRLRESDLLSDEEYQRKRAAIIDEL